MRREGRESQAPIIQRHVFPFSGTSAQSIVRSIQVPPFACPAPGSPQATLVLAKKYALIFCSFSATLLTFFHPASARREGRQGTTL